jgi:hypothetical protein
MTRVLDLTIRHDGEHVINLEIERNSDGRHTVHSNRWGDGRESFDAGTVRQAVQIALAAADIAATVHDVHIPLYLDEADNLFAVRERRSWWRRFWKRMRR